MTPSDKPKRRWPKSYEAQVASRCVHFNGTQNKVCEAGVQYPRPLWDQGKWPCFTDEGNGVGCDKCHFPTPEEVHAFVEKHDASVKKMMAAIAVVPEIKRLYKGRDWRGTRACPVCGGILHLTHAAINGHVWGKCETADCVAWME